MKTRIITYLLLLLSLSVTAQTKRALIIGLGEQQDKAWNKIKGDKDVAACTRNAEKRRIQVGNPIIY